MSTQPAIMEQPMRLSPYAKRNQTRSAEHEETVTGPARKRMQAAERVASAMAKTPQAVSTPDRAPKAPDANMARRRRLAQKMVRSVPAKQARQKKQMAVPRAR